MFDFDDDPFFFAEDDLEVFSDFDPFECEPLSRARPLVAPTHAASPIRSADLIAFIKEFDGPRGRSVQK